MLRIALFSGNYNCVRDGANRALNRLVAHALDRGHCIRVYSPTVHDPAFEPVGNLVSVPSIPFPGRGEYRLATGLPAPVEADVRAFAPDLVHVSAPDILGARAQSLARRMGKPIVASLHTRFETYLGYYKLNWLRFPAERWLATFYRRSDLVLVPNAALAAEIARQAPTSSISLWSRGVDRQEFDGRRRDWAWRKSVGIAPDDVALLFFGRIVPEKGLDVFVDVVLRLRARALRVRPIVVGDGPALGRLRRRLGDGVFTGHLSGAALGRAVASADVLLNPSVTEAFGNVTLEAMASGLAVVAADVPATRALLRHGNTGLLIASDDLDAYTDAVGRLVVDPALRRSLGRSASAASLGYDWTAILDSVLEDYQTLVAASKPELP